MTIRTPILASSLYAIILNHKTLEASLAFCLSSKIQSSTVTATQWFEIICAEFENDKEIFESIRADLVAIRTRDPSCNGYAYALLYLKGFHGIQCYRVANKLYNDNRKELAFALQSRISEVFGIDIHPAAKIGRGIMFDHATGIVVGETATIGDNCSIYHNVTLGGTGNKNGDRHPKVGSNVVIGACSSILGNIRIDDGVKIGPGSVVLKPLPMGVTAFGVPAKIVGDDQYFGPKL